MATPLARALTRRASSSFETLALPRVRGMEVGVGVYLDNILEVDAYKRIFTATTRVTARW